MTALVLHEAGQLLGVIVNHSNRAVMFNFPPARRKYMSIVFIDFNPVGVVLVRATN